MKKILHIILLLILFQSCIRKKPDCIEISPVIMSNKAQYNQFDQIKLKVLYSERASYKWFLGNEPLDNSSSEITIPSSLTMQRKDISCEATIGNCVKKTGIYIKYNAITIPSCALVNNIITIDGKQLQISDMAFNPINKTISGKIKGPGASINDSIKIELVSNVNLNDSVSIYNIVDLNALYVSPNNAKLNLVYGNLNFGYYNGAVLVFRKSSTGGNLSCCTVKQTAASIPSLQITASFSFDFTF